MHFKYFVLLLLAYAHVSNRLLGDWRGAGAGRRPDVLKGVASDGHEQRLRVVYLWHEVPACRSARAPERHVAQETAPFVRQRLHLTAHELKHTWMDTYLHIQYSTVQ